MGHPLTLLHRRKLAYLSRRLQGQIALDDEKPFVRTPQNVGDSFSLQLRIRKHKHRIPGSINREDSETRKASKGFFNGESHFHIFCCFLILTLPSSHIYLATSLLTVLYSRN